MEWIRTSDRLPMKNERVLILQGNIIEIARFDGDIFIENERYIGDEIEWTQQEIIYWMPLPETPGHPERNAEK